MQITQSLAPFHSQKEKKEDSYRIPVFFCSHYIVQGVPRNMTVCK